MEGGECHTVLWQASQQHSTNINSTLKNWVIHLQINQAD